MQSKDINLKCSVSNHDALVQLVCFEPDCKAFRFFCIQCQKDGIHQNHLQQCFELPILFEYVQKVGQECDNLLEILIKQWNSIKNQFQTLIEGIKKKYIISNTSLIQLNFSQLNQTLEELINFQSQNSLIKNKIQNTLFDFIEKIDKVEQEIKLHETPIPFHLSKQDIEKSQELFYKGYELYQDNDMYDEAIVILDQAINLNPNNCQAIWCKAASLRMLGQYKKAIIWADKALLLDPKHNFSLYCKAACLRMLDQYEEAILWANKALAIDPQDCFALSCKGSSLRLLKRFNEAIKIINASLTINPNHFDSLKEKGFHKIMYNLGACLHDEHQYQQAMLFYEQALRIFPGDQWTKDRLGIDSNQLKINVCKLQSKSKNDPFSRVNYQYFKVQFIINSCNKSLQMDTEETLRSLIYFTPQQPSFTKYLQEMLEIISNRKKIKYVLLVYQKWRCQIFLMLISDKLQFKTLRNISGLDYKQIELSKIFINFYILYIYCGKSNIKFNAFCYLTMSVNYNEKQNFKQSILIDEQMK